MHLGKVCRRINARIRPSTKRTVLVGVVMLFVGGHLGGIIIDNQKTKEAAKEMAQMKEYLELQGQKEVEQLQEKLDEALQEEVIHIPWYLTLVNNEHPMKKDYDLKVVELEDGYKVDARIVKAAKRMLRDAEKAGMRIEICSAYRSVKYQEQVFNESVQERLNQGMDYWEAFVDTRMSVAEPGTSEHAMGLALDLISDQYAELDERQETTKEARWLEKNCSKYGFILRYPPSKTDITGIIYEPWHYRYVGKEDAKKIMDLGITLEEYLAEYYGK